MTRDGIPRRVFLSPEISCTATTPATASADGDIFSVSPESASNSETGLGINQTESLSGIPISYMYCNGSAFVEGDKAVVEFQGQDCSNPRVIGFRNNPKPCCMIYETFAGYQFKYGEWSVVANWNPENDPEYYFSDETLHFCFIRMWGFRSFSQVPES